MQLNPACIAGIGTAAPPHLLLQEESRNLVRRLFEGVPGLERLLKVFDNSGIERRYLAMSPERYLTPRSFPEKNEVWAQVALELAEEAARKALGQAGLTAQELSAVFFASTTGIATPSLDASLVKRLDMPRHASRLPVWGLGCAGGVASLARAAELASARGETVLVVAVELCSVTFIAEDLSRTNLVGTSLFAGGAAAVVLAPEGAGPDVIGGFSRLFDHSEDMVAWDVVPKGLRVRLARSVPQMVDHLPEVLRQGTCRYGFPPRRYSTMRCIPVALGFWKLTRRFSSFLEGFRTCPQCAARLRQHVEPDGALCARASPSRNASCGECRCAAGPGPGLQRRGGALSLVERFRFSNVPVRKERPVPSRQRYADSVG